MKGGIFIERFIFTYADYLEYSKEITYEEDVEEGIICVQDETAEYIYENIEIEKKVEEKKTGDKKHDKIFKEILQNKKVLRTSKRNTLILPEYLDKIIYVYNGLTFKKLRITEDMIGTNFGQYIFTRKYCKHKVKNKILIKK